MTCRKCDGRMVEKTYHRGWADCRVFDRASGSGEHLHYECKTCRYDWIGPTADHEVTRTWEDLCGKEPSND